MVFTAEQFMNLAAFAMCNDQPENVEFVDVGLLHETLDEIAIIDLGCNDWIQAYHEQGTT